ncbi:hypothetical protein [Williamsia sterculiae]|uniref:Uncharacterized protein n=1 Tax=Williamsia sterculiae TaxID=1344003 RepID=A0A1N7FW27_9NOCA|nr:hypothetical protein [Williamsia sterculiae]SIS04531.1 hypothetical protein SAMN05445060_2341 [Williamsia sterculiae]
MVSVSFDRDRVLAALTFVDTVEWFDSPSVPDDLSVAWRRLAAQSDAVGRKDHALSMWGTDLRARLPRFGAVLEHHLLDVVPARLRFDDEGHLYLLYVTVDGTQPDDPYVVWMGSDPRTSGTTEPASWPLLPRELQTFERRVHPSWGCNHSPTDFGLVPPAEQVDLFRRDGFDVDPGGSPEEFVVGEYQGRPVDLSELTEISHGGGQHSLAVSPRFAPGEVVYRYEGDFEVGPVWPHLDLMFVSPYYAAADVEAAIAEIAARRDSR